MEIRKLPGYQIARKMYRSLVPVKQQQAPLFFCDDQAFSNKPLSLHKTALGNYFLPAHATGDVIARCMKKGEIFEPEIVAVAKKYIQKGSIVLDVGSNFGQMALMFAEFTGDQGQVLAFEADDYIFNILQKNIDVNKAYNVRAYLGAVYDNDGQDMFYPVQDLQRFSSYGSYGLEPQATEGRTIQTLTIDSLNIQEPISFMKIDIQGSDLFAMKGAVQTINKHRMPILFEFEQQFQSAFNTSFQDYIDFIDSISYRVQEVVNGINYLIVPKETYAHDEEKIDVTTLRHTTTQFLRATANTEKEQEIKCHFLQSRKEVDQCTAYLARNGYVSHRLRCKDWDLAYIIPHIGDGNFLDMGSTDSYILKNVLLKRTKGEKYGIDFCNPDVPLPGAYYSVGDIMATGLPSNYFQNITCLSVLEHNVDFEKLAQEASRLLVNQGKFFVTFDYWNPKISHTKNLYNLPWQPLDQHLLIDFIQACKKQRLELVNDINFITQDAVITQDYYSPQAGIAYTFGLVVLQKIVA